MLSMLSVPSLDSCVDYIYINIYYMGEYYYYAFCSLVGYKFSFLQFMYMIVVELQQSGEEEIGCEEILYIYHDELSHFFSGNLSNLSRILK